MNKKYVPILISVFMLTTLITITNVKANSTTIYVDPQLSTVETFHTFQINISASQVVDLAGWDFKLYYPNTLLNATSITEGSFLKTAGSTHFLNKSFTDNYNTTHGMIWAACVLQGQGPGATGSGALATITLKAKLGGNATLHLDETDLIDSKMPPNHITHTTIDGIVEILVPDIAITNLTASKTIVGQGFSMKINVTVENQGHYTETFNVTAYANTTTIATLTTITLPSGNSTTITFIWNTTGVAKGNYTIKAEATLVPGETDITDNTLTDGWVIVTIPGDVNGDNKVTGLDQIMVGLALFTKPGNVMWNPQADVSGDCKVTGLDQIMVGLHLFEKC